MADVAKLSRKIAESKTVAAIINPVVLPPAVNVPRNAAIASPPERAGTARPAA
jgi:hypothetical protein